MTGRGRGRLSSLDLVPEHAQDDIMWACAELNRRQRSQADILFELNDRLAVKGVDEISSSAFNRKAMKLAALHFRHEEYRFIAAGLNLSSKNTDEATVALGELLKMLVWELSQNQGEISTKGAMELARAYQAIVSVQYKSTARREEEIAKAEKAVDEAIAKTPGAKGLTDDMKTALRAELFGRTVEKK